MATTVYRVTLNLKQIDKDMLDAIKAKTREQYHEILKRALTDLYYKGK